MVSRKKILIVAGNISHLDQFVIHGFFKELSKTASIYLTLPEQELATERLAEMSKRLEGVFTEILPYKYSANAKQAGYQLGAALTYRHRKLATGYQVRILESLFGGLQLPIKFFCRETLKICLTKKSEIFKRLIHEIPAMVRGTKVFFWVWSKSKIREVNSGCLIGEVMESVSPDATVTFMQRQAGFVNASLAAADQLGIPTLLIPYKWDNASSKSPLVKAPTKLLVYNKSIKEVCARLHKMELGSVVAVGSVEIGNGKEVESTSQSVLIPLIGATTDTASAIVWLKCLSSLATENETKDLFKNLKLIWRPYPTLDKKNFEFMHQFIKNHPMIELDKDMSEGTSHRSNKLSLADAEVAYLRYVALLNSALFVVSEGTSVIVDARARGLPVIYPAFKKNAVIGSQWHRLNTSEHLKGLRDTNGVFIAENEEELKRLVIKFLKNPQKIRPDNLGENIFVDDRTYARRVLDVIDDALAEKASQKI